MESARILAGILTAIAALFVLSFAGGAQAPAAHGPADLVIHNAKVHTVDPSRPEAQALAIVGDRIRAVGSEDEIRAWIAMGTRVLDAHGATVLPGFNDSHVHFVDGSSLLSQVHLAGGTILHDAEGNPMGALKDAAAGLVERVIPPPSEERLTRAIRAGLEETRR